MPSHRALMLGGTKAVALPQQANDEEPWQKETPLSPAGVWGQAKSRNFFENKTLVVADGAVR